MDSRESSITAQSWWKFFRIALFLSALSLAFYIVFKYVTQLHAITGLYAFMFPLSSFLALSGMYLAVKPMTACDCGGGLRIGAGAIAGGWLVTGLSCTPGLAALIAVSPLTGILSTSLMLVQHVFLSLCIIAFAAFPGRMTAFFGLESVTEKTGASTRDGIAAS